MVLPNTSPGDVTLVSVPVVNDGKTLATLSGLPFVFDKFRLDARLAPEAEQPPDGPMLMQGGVAPADQSYRMPLGSDVMTYSAR